MKIPFLITYDLKKTGKDYESVTKEIKKIGVWWHCLGSVWIIISNLDCSQLRNKISRYMDKNDELLVVELAGSWATSNLSKNCNDWLKNNL